MIIYFLFLILPLKSKLETNKCYNHFHLIKTIDIILQDKMSVIPQSPAHDNLLPKHYERAWHK